MNYKFKTEPYAHQLKALKMSWDKPYFAYFMEMGTGKSKVLIDNIAMLYKIPEKRANCGKFARYRTLFVFFMQSPQIPPYCKIINCIYPENTPFPINFFPCWLTA